MKKLLDSGRITDVIPFLNTPIDGTSLHATCEAVYRVGHELSYLRRRHALLSTCENDNKEVFDHAPFAIWTEIQGKRFTKKKIGFKAAIEQDGPLLKGCKLRKLFFLSSFTLFLSTDALIQLVFRVCSIVT